LISQGFDAIDTIKLKMKKTILSLMLASVSLVFAQGPVHFVACGGKFEYNVTQYQDRASIGYLNMTDKSYVPLDYIQVESVQEIASSGEQNAPLFLAAQDSIIKYFVGTHTLYEEKHLIREAQVEFKGIKTIKATDQYLVAGRWYGAGDYLVVYDATDLSVLYAHPTINTEISDILFLDGNKVAVSYNLKSKTDECAPYGCFSDSIGKIEVIDLTNFQTLKSIDLGSAGKGSISLVLNTDENEGQFFAVSSSSNLVHYINSSFEIDTVSQFIGLKNAISQETHTEDGRFLASFSNGDYASIDYNEEARLFSVLNKKNDSNGASPFESKSFSVKGSNVDLEDYNNSHELVWFNTDFDTYGSIIVNSGRDTIYTHVSPETLYSGYYLGATAVNKSVNEDNRTTVFASQIHSMDLTNLKIYALNGLEINSSSTASDLNINALAKGVYILIAEENNVEQRFKVYQD
jgi:hypothetical protein